MAKAGQAIADEVKRYKERGERVKQEIFTAIKETGVVRNTHKPFDPKLNPRRKVPTHQAKVIAWSIAKSEGNYVGNRPTRT